MRAGPDWWSLMPEADRYPPILDHLLSIRSDDGDVIFCPLFRVMIFFPFVAMMVMVIGKITIHGLGLVGLPKSYIE